MLWGEFRTLYILYVIPLKKRVSKMQYVDCFYYYIRYRTYNALYHSCSTAFSVLEESGQGHLVARGYLGLFSFFFERDRSTLLACLLVLCVPKFSRLIQGARRARAIPDFGDVQFSLVYGLS